MFSPGDRVGTAGPQAPWRDALGSLGELSASDAADGSSTDIAMCHIAVLFDDPPMSAYGNVPEARAALGKYPAFYNTKRPHSSLDRQTPDQAYFNALQPIPVAA